MIELSIVIPVYNVEEYLKECLESVYSLNIKKEIILVDDSSPDNSWKIIEEYKGKYPEETVVIKQKNTGVSGARNNGLEIAAGEYIIFIDSDDFIKTKEFEKIFYETYEDKLDIGIGNGNYYYKNGDTKPFNRSDKIKTNIIFPGKEYFKLAVETGSHRDEVWDDIYRREFLIKNNLKFKKGLCHEDMIFSIQALIRAEKVKYIDCNYYMYRQRENSIMTNLNEKTESCKMYIAKELLKKENIEIKGLGHYLLDRLWEVYKRNKATNFQVIVSLLKYGKPFTLKQYFRILRMLVYSFFIKKMEPFEIKNK